MSTTFHEVTTSKKWNIYAIFALIAVAVPFPIRLIISTPTHVSRASEQNITLPALDHDWNPLLNNAITIILILLFLSGLISAHVSLRRKFRALRGQGIGIAALAVGYGIIGIFLLFIVASFVIYLISLLARSGS